MKNIRKQNHYNVYITVNGKVKRINVKYLKNAKKYLVRYPDASIYKSTYTKRKSYVGSIYSYGIRDRRYIEHNYKFQKQQQYETYG